MLRTLMRWLFRAFHGTAPTPPNAERYAVSVHHDGTFSFYDPRRDCWTLNALIVPHHVLASLPRQERERMQRLIAAVDA